MRIPFTTESFFELFGEYNQGVFPVQIIFYLLSFFIIYLLIRKKDDPSKVISLILGFFWLWMGFVYHILFFSKINPAAYLFGALFILQGSAFLYAGVFRDNLEFRYSNNVYSITAWVLIIYALFIYPVIGHFSGHFYPYAPEMSAPCPTTIFTFAILLFTSKRISKYLLVIPFAWSVIGFSAAAYLNVVQDYGLIISGVVVLFMIILRDIRKRLPAAVRGA
jgi:hypothetical protein